MRTRIAFLGIQYLGGTVVAHEVAWEKIKSFGDAFRQQSADSLALCSADAAAEVAADWRITLPQITFTNKLVLFHGDVPVVIQHVGGATPGSVWVHLPKQGVLFMGDLATPHAHPLAAEADLGTWLDLLGQVQDQDFAAKTHRPGPRRPVQQGGA